MPVVQQPRQPPKPGTISFSTRSASRRQNAMKFFGALRSWSSSGWTTPPRGESKFSSSTTTSNIAWGRWGEGSSRYKQAKCFPEATVSKFGFAADKKGGYVKGLTTFWKVKSLKAWVLTVYRPSMQLSFHRRNSELYSLRFVLFSQLFPYPQIEKRLSRNASFFSHIRDFI